MHIYLDIINPMDKLEQKFDHFELCQLVYFSLALLNLFYLHKNLIEVLHIIYFHCSTSASLIGSLTLGSLEVLRVSPVVSTGGGVQVRC